MSLNVNFDNVKVTTIQQAREVFLRITEDTLLSKINVQFGEDTFTDDVIGVFRKSRKKLAGMIGVSAAVIAGAGVATVGAALIPLTLGGSVGIMASGAFISAVGASVSVGFSIESLVKDRKMREPVKQALTQLCNLEKEIVKLIVTASITHKIISCMLSKEDSSVDDKVTNNSAAKFPPDTEKTINTFFENLIQYLKVLDECGSFPEMCESLANVAKTLKSVFKLIIDHSAEYVDAKAHYTIEKAFVSPFNYLFQIPVSPFILTLIEKQTVEKKSILAFWLKHLDKTMERNDEGEEEAKLPTNTSVDEHKVLETRMNIERVKITSVYYDENSKKFGEKILKFVRAVSAAMLIIEPSVSKEEFEFLGKSNFDFLKKDREDWPSAIATISDLMIAVNKSLNLDQHARADVQEISQS